MERSYNDQISPAKKLGAMLFGEPKAGLTYAVSAFQMNDVENDYRSEKMSYAARGTMNFAELMLEESTSVLANSHALRTNSEEAAANPCCS